MATATKTDLNKSLGKLNEIVSWFEDQTEMDVEKGLQNVKEGVSLIKACKERLAEIENEFIDVQREISDDAKKPAKATSKKTADIEGEIDASSLPF